MRRKVLKKQPRCLGLCSWTFRYYLQNNSRVNTLWQVVRRCPFATFGLRAGTSLYWYHRCSVDAYQWCSGARFNHRLTSPLRPLCLGTLGTTAVCGVSGVLDKFCPSFRVGRGWKSAPCLSVWTSSLKTICGGWAAPINASPFGLFFMSGNETLCSDAWSF